MRKLAGALTSLNIKYIIIESVLIVNGILVAITINNWNEKRTNEERAERYVEYLVRDLNRQVESVQAFVEFEETVMQESYIALQNLSIDGVYI